MNRVVNTFDYVFYRIYCFWRDRDEDNVGSRVNAYTLLSLMQFFTILILAAVSETIFFQHQVISQPVFVLILISITIINYFRYERHVDIESFKTKWQPEHFKIKRRKGKLIGLYLLFSILCPITYGVLKHNLGLIR